MDRITTQERERSRGRPSRRWQDDIVKKNRTIRSRTPLDRRQWRAWMEGYILQWTDDIDGGLHPAVDRQWRVLMKGYILLWTDRRQWRALMEGYILQWTDDSGGY